MLQKVAEIYYDKLIKEMDDFFESGRMCMENKHFYTTDKKEIFDFLLNMTYNHLEMSFGFIMAIGVVYSNSLMFDVLSAVEKNFIKTKEDFCSAVKEDNNRDKGVRV